MNEKYISCKRLLKRWNIELHELMDLVRNGLEPYHPGCDKKYCLGLSTRNCTWIGGPEEYLIFDDIAEFFPHLENALFLRSDVKAHALDVKVAAVPSGKSPTQSDKEKAGKIPEENYFYREGIGWHIGFQGENDISPNYKYIRYITLILEKRGKPITALELVRAVDVSANQSEYMSNDQALDEDLSIGNIYKDKEVSTKQLKDIEVLQSEMERETDPLVKKELKDEFDQKVKALKKMNALVNDEGKPVKPHKKQRIDDPHSKRAQSAIRKGLKNAYSAFDKSRLKKLAKHLRKNIKPDGAYDFKYCDIETHWKIKQ
jgi:hypothetical protein